MDDKCKYIDCENEIMDGEKHFCEIHINGGDIGNGIAFEQYEIIEEDFINFIKYVPLNEEKHLEVYSPILRDIIIRTCSQIEIFFREWALLEISDNKNKNAKLYESYTKNEGRFWKFSDYYTLISDKKEKIYVSNLKQNICPFENWIEPKKTPYWWQAYNSIKHGERSNLKKATLEHALNSVAALFLLHCMNKFSYKYLYNMKSLQFDVNYSSLVIRNLGITTPIDKKKYLFKYETQDHNFYLKIADKNWI